LCRLLSTGAKRKKEGEGEKSWMHSHDDQFLP
jgi:hypothetical protein